MFERNSELRNFKLRLGGILSREASEDWEKADILNNIPSKSIALFNKTQALIYQNPGCSVLTTNRGLKSIQLSIENFWEVID